MTLDQRPLPAAVEQRMPGDQPVALEDLDLVGHAVHLDEAPARSIGNRVIVAADTDHAFAADPAIELEHRAERDQRQEQQRRLFLGERLVDDTAGGGMHARVGDITEPVLELAVEIVEIAEAAAEDSRHRGRGQGSEAENDQESGATEQPGAETGPFPLLGQLGLRQLDLLVDQCGQLLGQVGDQLGRRLVRPPIIRFPPSWVALYPWSPGR